ncbi:Golgi phosphoprotein 3 GPP34 [Isoptericola sp. CG 20/1183]|uniref:Golgi phosphoprotein 3 GPP34 n=1 Tax=Isoptericola halotolerans TaxID=300560 RepID=A0ABX5EIC3_9MICO|nr:MULTISPECIES: GPP34 family phosphoprotein [Isoptericola]PRZ08200.1 Golgi phosphoprotein 3 GPP34 [Isoptericola halotolerans]PRZ08997.1 Golgi phosphoprotein 3 GPP34 [Isoptericola sp. CG 20/1183]
MSERPGPPAAPTLAEDLLLLLFQPRSGTIAGENTLYYVLAGGVLADLALGEHVRTTRSPGGNVRVGAVEDRAPSDPVLRSAWDYVAGKPRGVQTVLAAIGPGLRAPLLENVVARGDIRQESRTVLGLFRSTALVDGGTPRRAELVESVRAVLVDGAEPTPRVAALGGLLAGSGTLPQLHREIPWTTPVIKRAHELERGTWGAQAAGAAVARTVTATIVNSTTYALTLVPRG